MAEPASGLTLAWLLDHAWTGLLLILGVLYRMISRHREDTDAKFAERERIISEDRARMAVMERRQDESERRQAEDRQKTSEYIHEIRDEMRLIRKDFALGFKEVGDRITRLITEDRRD